MPSDAGEPVQFSLFYDVLLVDRAVGELMRIALADSDLSPLEYGIYSALLDTPGRTATALAADLATPLTTMVDWLARPLQRGHIERSRHPQDRRAWALRLTPDGEAVHSHACRAFSAVYEQFLARPGVDTQTQRAALHAIRDAARDVTRKLLAAPLRT